MNKKPNRSTKNQTYPSRPGVRKNQCNEKEKGKEPVILHTGDVIKCDKDIEHWHSSTKFSDVTYLALYGGSEPTIWTEVLSQKYYDEVAAKLKKSKNKDN